MKQFTKHILFVSLLLTASVSAQAQYVMNVRKSDGTKVQYSVSEVDSVWFSPAPTYVDLGLSVKWATFNIGASAPEDAGDYFAWGEVEPKAFNSYTEANYRWYDGVSTVVTKYNGEDLKTTLDPEDDAAHVLWGGTWRMPTRDEFKELMDADKCTWTWKGNGYEVESKVEGFAGNKIFIPAAGEISSSGLDAVGEQGHYYSSTLADGGNTAAWGVMLLSMFKMEYTVNRSDGRTIRPVCPKE